MNLAFADLIEAVLEDEGHRILIAANGKQGARDAGPGTSRPGVPRLHGRRSRQPIPVMVGMTRLHLLEQGNWSQTGMRLDHRADFAAP
jgi:hypothetical protein